jgi:glycosyltransferase involved in cell wall biosynthesis
MRIALISDIHANLPALEAVLAHRATLEGLGATYHLGDLVGYAPWPNEVVARIRDEGIAGVAGNYDSTTATDYAHCGCRYEDPKQEGFGYNKIQEYLDMVNPDVVMIYNDPYTISKFIESMKHEHGKSPYKLWLYVDQVYTGIAPPLIEILHKHADRIYCFTEIWKKKFLEYGPFPDVRVLGHAVDANVFTCMSSETRKGIRTNMGVSDDAVVFLNINRNSQRKRLDLTVAGFVGLLKKNPTSPYYLIVASNLQPQTGAHYDVQRIFIEELKENGMDVQTFARRLLLIDTSPPNVWSDEAINQLYNSADVGINTSDGEGFGLCQIEHMYTGAPQIVTDVGAYRDFMDSSVAEFIPVTGKHYFAGGMPHGFSCPSFLASDVTESMVTMIGRLSERRANVANYTYPSWSRVCDQWLEDVLTLVESTVSVPVTSIVPA